MSVLSPVRPGRALSFMSGGVSPRRVGAAVLALVAALLVVPAPAQANGAPNKTISVCTAAGPGCDYTTIQAAINAANSGDTITVAAGTYAETLTINKSIKLVGPYDGVSPNNPANLWETNSARVSPAVIMPPSLNNGHALNIVAPNLVVEISGLDLDMANANSSQRFLEALNQHDFTLTVSETVFQNGKNVPAGQWRVQSNRLNLVVQDSRFAGSLASNGISIWNSADPRIHFEGNVWLDNKFWAINMGEGLARAQGRFLNNWIGNSQQGDPGNPNATNRQIGFLFTGHWTSLNVVGNTFRNLDSKHVGFYGYSPSVRFTGVASVLNNLFLNFNDSTSRAIVGPRNLGGVPVSESITISTNAFVGGLSGGSVGSNEPSAVVKAPSNWWGQPSGPLETQTLGSVVANPWIVSYTDDPSRRGQPGFWPVGLQAQATIPADQLVSVALPAPNAGNPEIAAKFKDPVTVTVIERQSLSEVAGGSSAPFEVQGGRIFELILVRSAADKDTKVTVCADAANSESRLFHFAKSKQAWEDITTTNDGTRVCGATADFSPFAVGVPKAIVVSEEPVPAAPPVQPLLPVVMPSVTVADNTATCTVGEYSRSVSAVDVSLLLDGTVLDTRALASGVTSTSWPTEATWAGGTLTCRVFARGENVVSTATSPALTLPGGAPLPPPRDIPKEPLRLFQSVSFTANGSGLSVVARDRVATLVSQGGRDVRYRVVGFKTLTEWWRGAKVARPRAEAVADALVAAGVAREQILIRYGGISDLGGVAGRVVRISTLP